MTRVRVTRAAVFAAAVAVVAGAATGAVLLFGGDARVQHPESTPAPSTAPEVDDGLPPGSSDSTAGSAAASPSAGTTRPSDEPPDPEPVESEPGKDDAEASAADPGLEFALEIVEAVDLDLELAGGARQESPVESTGPDESGGGGSGGAASAQGDVYTWQDGDRTVGARLQLDLVVLDDGAIVPNDEIAADTSNDENGPRGADGGGKSDGARGSGESDGSTSGSNPVFLSESGELMTLPGGVVVVLDPEWDADATAAFFAGNGIVLSRVSSLDYLTNGFFVETDPGFPSLDLANALAAQAGVELSSPNWWRERTAK